MYYMNTISNSIPLLSSIGILVISVFILPLIFIRIMFRFLTFLVSKFKLDQKYAKPREILALIGIELLGLLLIINNNYILLAMMSLITGIIRVIGLWKMKKWVLSFFLISYSISIISIPIQTILSQPKNINITFFAVYIAATISVSIIILRFYYSRVYLPHKNKFT